MNNAFLFRVKATRRRGGESWYIYDGATFTKTMAEATAKDCNRYWPDIEYVVEEVKDEQTPVTS